MDRRRTVAGCLLALTAVFIFSLFGCSDSGPRETVTIADFHFADPDTDTAFGAVFDPEPGLHWFGEGWDHADPPGVWTLGGEAVLHLRALGLGDTLRMTCSTHPALAAEGQTVTVLINGEAVTDTFLSAEPWQALDIAVPLPPKSLRRGLNRLVVRPGLHHVEGDSLEIGTRRQIGIFLKDLSVTARMTAKEQVAWNQWRELPGPDAEWTLAPYEGETPPRVSDRPDVLLIVLDALRADHVGCYGYGRATTPTLDSLAAAGLKFSQVHTVSPFTMTAVPSLLTGLSWRDHGVLAKGQALSDSFVTLAEILRDHGYLTLGWSDNPFCSRGTGADQGFAEFVEAWHHPAHGDYGTNSEIVATMARERMAAGLGADPVFCYLHMMPPHDPYIPGPDHDLWSDPGYAGVHDGTSDLLQEVIDGKRSWDEADRRKLEALYDGNLHRIDAAVAGVLADWRALDRDRDLLVVVTADHGEAFAEHGEFGHLTTVYDEMTHIPLLMSPAESFGELSKVTDELLAITDITPMLLRVVEARPPRGTLWPNRYLALLDDAPTPAAAVAIRSHDISHNFGLRGDRWLAVHDGFNRQQLFDLRKDPGAEVNLRIEQDERYREMLGRLRAMAADKGEFEAAEETLSDEDRRRLEALGY